MPQTVIHQQIYKPSFSGGVINTTLCGKVSNAKDDANIADTGEAVTCKLCLRILANPKHYRMRWMGWTP